MGLVKTIYNVLGVFTFGIIALFSKKVCTNFTKNKGCFCVYLTGRVVDKNK